MEGPQAVASPAAPAPAAPHTPPIAPLDCLATLGLRTKARSAHVSGVGAFLADAGGIVDGFADGGGGGAGGGRGGGRGGGVTSGVGVSAASSPAVAADDGSSACGTGTGSRCETLRIPLSTAKSALSKDVSEKSPFLERIGGEGRKRQHSAVRAEPQSDFRSVDDAQPEPDASPQLLPPVADCRRGRTESRVSSIDAEGAGGPEWSDFFKFSSGKLIYVKPSRAGPGFDPAAAPAPTPASPAIPRLPPVPRSIAAAVTAIDFTDGALLTVDSAFFRQFKGLHETAAPTAAVRVGLRRLVLDRNLLASLPESDDFVIACRSVEILHCAHNKLTTLPLSLGKLAALKELVASNNQIGDAGSIGGCCALRSLDLSSNCLSTLPPKLALLPALVSLDLTLNDFSEIALPEGKGVFFPSLESISLDWFRYTAPELPTTLSSSNPLTADAFAKFLAIVRKTKGTLSAIDVIRALSSKDILIDGVDRRRGRSRMHQAALADHRGVIQALADAGVEVNALDGYGFSPLLLAVRERHLAAVRLLLSLGARVDMGAGHLGSPLHLSTINLDTEMTRELCAHGCLPSQPDVDGNTALHVLMSIYDRNTAAAEAVARILLAHAVDCNALNRYNWGALHFAARRGQVAAVNFAVSLWAAASDACRGGRCGHAAGDGGHAVNGGKRPAASPPGAAQIFPAEAAQAVGTVASAAPQKGFEPFEPKKILTYSASTAHCFPDARVSSGAFFSNSSSPLSAQDPLVRRRGSDWLKAATSAPAASRVSRAASLAASFAAGGDTATAAGSAPCVSQWGGAARHSFAAVGCGGSAQVASAVERGAASTPQNSFAAGVAGRPPTPRPGEPDILPRDGGPGHRLRSCSPRRGGAARSTSDAASAGVGCRRLLSDGCGSGRLPPFPRRQLPREAAAPPAAERLAARLGSCPRIFDLDLRGGTHLWSALHLSGHANRVRVVMALLRGGADPLVKNRDLRTPREVAKSNYVISKLLAAEEQAALFVRTHPELRAASERARPAQVSPVPQHETIAARPAGGRTTDSPTGDPLSEKLFQTGGAAAGGDDAIDDFGEAFEFRNLLEFRVQFSKGAEVTDDGASLDHRALPSSFAALQVAAQFAYIQYCDKTLDVPESEETVEATLQLTRADADSAKLISELAPQNERALRRLAAALRSYLASACRPQDSAATIASPGDSPADDIYKKLAVRLEILRFALIAGHEDLVRCAVFALGADSSRLAQLRDREGETLLHLLCQTPFTAWGCPTRGRSRRAEILAYLLNLRACRWNSGARDARGRTSLFLAVKAGDLALVQALLRREDADPNRAEDTTGWTPLLYALALSRRGEPSREMITQCLLHHPAVDANRADFYGWAPLCEALARRDFRTVSLLACRGAKPRSPHAFRVWREATAAAAADGGGGEKAALIAAEEELLRANGFMAAGSAAGREVCAAAAGVRFSAASADAGGDRASLSPERACTGSLTAGVLPPPLPLPLPTAAAVPPPQASPASRILSSAAAGVRKLLRPAWGSNFSMADFPYCALCLGERLVKRVPSQQALSLCVNCRCTACVAHSVARHQTDLGAGSSRAPFVWALPAVDAGGGGEVISQQFYQRKSPEGPFSAGPGRTAASTPQGPSPSALPPLAFPPQKLTRRRSRCRIRGRCANGDTAVAAPVSEVASAAASAVPPRKPRFPLLCGGGSGGPGGVAAEGPNDAGSGGDERGEDAWVLCGEPEHDSDEPLPLPAAPAVPAPFSGCTPRALCGGLGRQARGCQSSPALAGSPSPAAAAAAALHFAAPGRMMRAASTTAETADFSPEAPMWTPPEPAAAATTTAAAAAAYHSMPRAAAGGVSVSRRRPLARKKPTAQRMCIKCYAFFGSLLNPP